MSLPREPRAVVFDMDGLIVDTEVLHREAMLAAVRARGHDMPLALYMGTIGMPGAAARGVMSGHYGPGFDVEMVWAEAARRFRELARARHYMKAGVKELLDALDRAGLPRAIATSSRHQEVDLHLSTHGLKGRFDVVVAQGDYARGKPNPDPYLTAAERLGLAPAMCLALEDSHNGVRAA